MARPWAAPFGALVSAPPLPFLMGRPLALLPALIYGPLLVFAGIVSGRQNLKLAGSTLCALLISLLLGHRPPQASPGSQRQLERGRCRDRART